MIASQYVADGNETSSFEQVAERVREIIRQPNLARVWNYMLGGKNHFAVDRRVCSNLLNVDPLACDLARANEEFRMAATTWLATEAGITQFIDCGPGLPPRLEHSTHEVAQSHDVAARVLYVDSDLVVLRHGYALLATDERTRVGEANIFDPVAVFSNASKHLNLKEPVALLHTATWPWFDGDPAEAAKVMKAFVDGLAIGSYTVISHFLDPEIPDLTQHAFSLQDALLSELGKGRFLPGHQIEALFPDQEFIGPGIVACDDMLEGTSVHLYERRTRQCIAGGIGRISRH